ncbi:MAG TPA: 6-bladed beta-propeller [Thermoanaerobaculia bacterium]|nr:6-bladed beta-propeller [Thermoanaerobaculia bacterium]
MLRLRSFLARRLLRSKSGAPFSARLGWCVLLLAMAGCGRNLASDTVALPPALSISQKDRLVLGDSPDAPAELLFGDVRGVRTDGEGRIYVADAIAMKVRVFSPAGEPLRSLGERGRKPGEFRDITCFDVGLDGSVLVLDGLNGRITRFSPTGTLVASAPLDTQAIVWPRTARAVGADHELLLYRKPASDGWREGSEPLLHLLDGELHRELAAFGALSQVADPDLPVVGLFHEIHPGRVWVERDGGLLYAPTLYRGEIYRFEEREGGWASSQVLRGYAPGDPLVPLDARAPRGNREFVFSMSFRKGRAVAEIRNASLGLFRLKDGRIVHFTQIANGARRAFGAEVFTADGRLLGYSPIEEFTAGRGRSTLFPIVVEWKDEQDLFYLRDIREFPMLRVVRFTFG